MKRCADLALYAYDNLNRPTTFHRGDLDQDRTHNLVNETTGITEQSQPQQSQWADPVYSARGNATSIPKPIDLENSYACKYDACRRLVGSLATEHRLRCAIGCSVRAKGAMIMVCARIGRLCLFGVAVTGIWLTAGAGPSYGQGYSPEEVGQMLSLYDTEFLGSFSLKVEAVIPHGMLQPGRYTAQLELTGKTGEQYLKSTTSDVGQVRYVAGAKGLMPYDADGNLSVPHNRDSYIALQGAEGVVRDDPQTIFVSPTGDIVRTIEAKPCVSKYPPDNDDARNLLFRYLLPLGRGYSQLISRVDKVTAGEDGLIHVEAHGRSFSPHPGKWVLEIDTERKFLIRRATFTRADAQKPSLICESEGQSNEEVALGQRGTFDLGGYRVSVSLSEYTRVFDEQLKKKVLDKVGAVPPEVVILDYHVIDSAGAPKVIKKSGVP